MVWEETTASNTEIYYARRMPDGSWSNPYNLSNNPGVSRYPKLALDDNDNVHVGWVDDSPGNVEILYAYQLENGAWSAPQNVSNSAGHSDAQQLAVDKSGTIHLAWMDNTPGVFDIFYSFRSANGTWSDPRNISQSFGTSGEPQMSVDQSGITHLIWYDSYSDIPAAVYYSRRTSGDLWSAPQNISNTPLYNTWDPRLAVDDKGLVHVIWNSNFDIYYTYTSPDGVWTAPQNLSNDSGACGFAQMIADKIGVANIAWRSASAPISDIFYVGPDLAGHTDQSVASQVVTISVSTSAPTLSFLYWFSGAYPASGSRFGVEINNGITNTGLLSTTVGTNWVHNWFDLSSWAGQTVTLTFSVYLTAGIPSSWAYLDEVTLGSAYPDQWVYANSPAALPGEQAVYRITYANRGGAPASGVRITATLPSELLFVDADPPPIPSTALWVWEWDAGDLPAQSAPYTIVLTTSVAPTATLFSTLTGVLSIGTASPEIETANNTGEINTFVGRQIYLPVITKD